MQYRTRSKRIIASTILVMSILCSCTFSKSISSKDKENILAISNSISEASQEEDIEKILSYFSKDLIFQMSTSSGKQNNLNYQGYKDYLSKAFPLISSYQYSRSNEDFKLEKNSDIVFEFDLEEKYVLNNQPFTDNHRQIWHMRKEDGELKIYRIDARQ